MRSSITFLAVLLVVGLGSGVFAWRAHARRDGTERALTAATEARRRLETESGEAQKRIAQAGTTELSLRKQLEDLRANGAKAGPAAARKLAPAPMTALRQALLNDPHLQNLQIAAVQPKFESTYHPLFQELNLSPAQVKEFLAIVFKRYEQEMDLAAVREMQTPPANDSVFAKMREELTANTSAALTTLLGPDGYRRFSDYERTVPVREFLDQTAGASAVVGAAITGLQVDELTRIVSDASAKYRTGGTVDIRTVDWDQVMAGAKSVLTESQLAVFRLGVIQVHNMDRIRVLALTR